MGATRWPAAMERYRRTQLAADRSPGTIRLHRCRLAWLARRTSRPDAVTTDLLLEIIGTSGWQPETRKSVRSTYRSFFQWAHASGIVDEDPTVRLPTIRVPPAVPRPAPELVLRGTEQGLDPRTRLMIMLAAYGGLRAGEVARVHQHDFDGETLYVLGKGRKVRRVPVEHPELLGRLQRLEGYAFPNRWTGEPLTSGTVTRIVSSALPGVWTCHPLRHRAGTKAYEGTRDLLAVMTFLGHSRPETTMRYVQLPDDALRAAARAAAA